METRQQYNHLAQTNSSYRKSVKNIEDLRWDVKHWKYQRINCEDSSIKEQWESYWFPIRDKLCELAKDYEDSLSALEGKTPKLRSLLTNAAWAGDSNSKECNACYGAGCQPIAGTWRLIK